jgi:hypothetical protein
MDAQPVHSLNDQGDDGEQADDGPCGGEEVEKASPSTKGIACPGRAGKTSS